MATDLFLSPPVPQNPTSGMYSDKSGPSDTAFSAKIKTSRASNKVEGESFLTTLKEVTQNRNLAENSRPIGKTERSETKAPRPKGKMVEASDPAAGQNEETSALEQPQENGEAGQSGQIPVIGNFMDFIKILQEIGLHYSDGGSDGQNLMDVDSTDGGDVAALKMLMARLQQNEPVSSTELKAAFERLQQFIAEALGGNPAAVVEGNTGNGQSMNQMPASTRIFQWLKNLAAGLHQQSNENGNGAGAGSSGAKPPDSTISGAGGILEASADSIDPIGDSKAGSRVQSADNAGAATHLDGRNPMEPAKGDSAKLSSAAQVNASAQEANAVEKTDTESARSKEETVFLREIKTAGRAHTSEQMPSSRDRMLPNTAATNPVHQPTKQSPASGSNPSSASPATAAEGTVSKVLPENQAVKEGGVKLSSAISEDNGGKVIKTEAGGNDPGLLNPQTHQLEKTVESVSLPNETQAERNGLKTQTLDQIVQKAAIHLKNGQHEARIDLKPEFLGHIRMQVISDNHQVTVKILTEHGFVKDMIENNAHQLKADLQQQGLHIDKLEVSVFRDSDESGSPKDRLAGMRTRQGLADNGRQGKAGQDLPQENRRPRRNAQGATTVDYFA